jgi:hypothetical protein
MGLLSGERPEAQGMGLQNQGGRVVSDGDKDINGDAEHCKRETRTRTQAPPVRM